MKSIIILGSLFLSLNAFALTQIELAPGNTATIQAGDMAQVTCSGTSAIDTEGNVSAFCDNYTLYVEVSGSQNDKTSTFSLSNATTCNTALSKNKNKLGDFNGVKSLKFCDNYVLYTIKVSAAGEITSNTKSLSNATTCNNAL
jgi:hypothetical protein